MGRKRKLFLVILLSVLLIAQYVVVTPGEVSHGQTTDVNTEVRYAEDQVLVKFDPLATAREKMNVMAEMKLSTVAVFESGIELLKVKGNQPVEDVIAKLEKKSNVIFAEPDYFIERDMSFEMPEYLFNDPYFEDGSLWGLHNDIGLDIAGIHYDTDIDAPEAWDITKGDRTVVVAVIDTGVDIYHPDLAANIWLNPGEIPENGIDDDGNGFIDDVNGWDFYYDDDSVYDSPAYDDHGTHVSGTIAAIGDNGIGVVGVAPEVQIMPVKFLGPEYGKTSDAIQAIDYAKSEGADVINASWGGGGKSRSLETAIKSFPGVFVAAAGNAGVNTDRNPHYPSSYRCDNILSVASINSEGGLSWFSNYGTRTVDVAAPGEWIYSTYPEGGYEWFRGTSMAAPHVTGIVALMLSQDPAMDATSVINRIKSNTEYLPTLEGKIGTDGLVNAYASLPSIVPPTDPPTDPPPEATDFYVEGETSTPSQGATNVGLKTTVIIDFSMPIELINNGSTITFTSVGESGNVQNPVAIDRFSITGEFGDMLRIKYNGRLSSNTIYNVTIPIESVQSTSGDTLVDPFVLIFTTK